MKIFAIRDVEILPGSGTIFQMSDKIIMKLQRLRPKRTILCHHHDEYYNDKEIIGYIDSQIRKKVLSTKKLFQNEIIWDKNNQQNLYKDNNKS